MAVVVPDPNPVLNLAGTSVDAAAVNIVDIVVTEAIKSSTVRVSPTSSVATIRGMDDPNAGNNLYGFILYTST